MSEEVQTVAAPEVPDAPVAEEQVSAPVSEETAAPETETKEPEAKPAKTFTQEELDEIVKKRLAKEHRKVERYARAEAEAQMLREQLAQMQKPAPQQEDAKPQPDQFKTYEDYIEGLTDWKMRKNMEQLSQQTAQKQQMTAAQEYEARLRENLSRGVEKYEDFQEVVANIPASSVTTAMRDAIGESENAAEIAYYLGLNLKEAAEISKMSPIAQIRAIDKIGAKLSQGQTQTSNAPAPIKPVTAPSSAKVYDTTDPRSVSAMSTSEWIAAERARQAKKFGRR